MLERPTCTGTQDHEALLVVGIQHRVRVFLARRRRVKAEQVREWFKNEQSKGEPLSFRAEQLKLFCRENEIDVIGDEGAVNARETQEQIVGKALYAFETAAVKPLSPWNTPSPSPAASRKPTVQVIDGLVVDDA